jgi:hypothetical protein
MHERRSGQGNGEGAGLHGAHTGDATVFGRVAWSGCVESGHGVSMDGEGEACIRRLAVFLRGVAPADERIAEEGRVLLRVEKRL